MDLAKKLKVSFVQFAVARRCICYLLPSSPIFQSFVMLDAGTVFLTFVVRRSPEQFKTHKLITARTCFVDAHLLWIFFGGDGVITSWEIRFTWFLSWVGDAIVSRRKVGQWFNGCCKFEQLLKSWHGHFVSHRNIMWCRHHHLRSTWISSLKSSSFWGFLILQCCRLLNRYDCFRSAIWNLQSHTRKEEEIEDGRFVSVLCIKNVREDQTVGFSYWFALAIKICGCVCFNCDCGFDWVL